MRKALFIALVVIVLSVSAASATAAGVAPWSNERLTAEVKTLKTQNARQAVKIRSLQEDVTNLYEDTGRLELTILCLAGPPSERPEHCAALNN